MNTHTITHPTPESKNSSAPKPQDAADGNPYAGIDPRDMTTAEALGELMSRASRNPRGAATEEIKPPKNFTEPDDDMIGLATAAVQAFELIENTFDDARRRLDTVWAALENGDASQGRAALCKVLQLFTSAELAAYTGRLIVGRLALTSVADEIDAREAVPS